GFSGEDGRSTIFDYWGIPEHQKWMNNGKFDGGLLTEDQKTLRGFYKDILNLRLQHAALYVGDFIDLHTLNRNINHNDYPENVYSFIRYTAEEKLLIIANFDSKEQDVVIKISNEIQPILNLEAAKEYIPGLIFKNEAGSTPQKTGSFLNDPVNKIFKFKCSRHSVYVYKILNKGI
ncbi:MAG: alpha-amylase, partial [Bacteroidota bacterium]|nr:alpha-amylase [Bacteroidota bacterium]